MKVKEEETTSPDESDSSPEPPRKRRTTDMNPFIDLIVKSGSRSVEMLNKLETVLTESMENFQKLEDLIRKLENH